MENIYEKLRIRLDELATGYPETESKVEIRLLERLFTEEEAELFLQLSPILENPRRTVSLSAPTPSTTLKMEWGAI